MLSALPIESEMDRLFDPLNHLSPRQLDILCLAYQGYNRKEIKRVLCITHDTLRWHIFHIRKVLTTFHLNPQRPPRICLSPREREVACLVAEGLSNGEIAYALGITTSTVKQHLDRLFRKTATYSRVQLALKLHASDPCESDEVGEAA